MVGVLIGLIGIKIHAYFIPLDFSVNHLNCN